MSRQYTDASRARANKKRATAALANNHPHLVPNNGIEVYYGLKQVLAHMDTNTLTIADLSPLVAALRYIGKTIGVDPARPITNAVYV